MVEVCLEDDKCNPDFQFQYMIEEDLCQIIKRVRENRQKKLEQRLWDYSVNKFTITDQNFGEHAQSERLKSIHCPMDGNKTTGSNETSSKFRKISLEDSEVNGDGIEIDSESLPDISISERRSFKKQRSVRPKSSPVKADYTTYSSCFVPSINLENLDEEINSEDFFDSITELDEDNISNTSESSKRDNFYEKSRRLSFSTEQILRELYENEPEDFHDFSLFKMSVKTDLYEDSSVGNVCDKPKKGPSIDDYILGDPLLKDKFEKLRSKIADALEDIRTVSPKKYLDADSPEELLKSQKRDIEFYSRFARNYAYDFQRQIIKLGKLLTVAKKSELLNNETCQKLLVVHQTVLRGLQSYYKHAQTSLIDEVPEKIQEFICDFMKLSEMCVNCGILEEDELKKGCVRILEGPLEDEIEKNEPKVKATKSRRDIIKDLRSSETARIYTSVHDSPYTNRTIYKKK